MTTTARVLVVDDQADVREAARLLLKNENIQAETASSPSAALEALNDRIDLVLIDLNYTRDTTSGKEGLELLAEIRKADPALPVVVMTAWGNIPVAVEAMRRGARDFVEKPWDNNRLVSVIKTQIELGRALRRGTRLEAENRALRRERAITLIGECPAIHRLRDVIARIAPSDANVLITGENGSGKDVAAQLLHASSKRAKHAMISVNVGGLSEGVFESELFGHVKGAFTDAKEERIGRFELADGSTLFLDEIGNLSTSMQAKLLRVIETGELERVGSSKTRRVDVRIIAATNVDIAAAVASGAFRQDLLFRLNTVEIQMPPLRDRGDDIPLLARHFLERHAARSRRTIRGFSPEAERSMRQHPWPGNVRELDHAVERAVLLATGDQISGADLGLKTGSDSAGVRLDELSLEEVEKLLIQKALNRSEGNVSHAAKTLGLSRSGLYRRITKYNI
jgi:DNA-binding NtrC family response regulator